jgi:hypothetical protein
MKKSRLIILLLLVACFVASCNKTSSKIEVTHIPVKLKEDGNWSLLELKTGKLMFEGEFKNKPSVVVEGIFISENDKGKKYYNRIEGEKNYKQIAGPFYTAQTFTEGIAIVCKEDDSDFKVSPSPENHLRNNVNQFVNQTYEETIKKFKWSLDKNYTVGDIVFIENLDFNGLKDPPRTFFVCIKDNFSSKFITPDKSHDFWERDGCSKTIKACKKRFLNSPYISAGTIAYNASDVVDNIMPFGGFPGTDRFQYQ